MATQTLDLSGFRALFPDFSIPGTYPDALLLMMWEVATNYINANDSLMLSGPTLQYAIYLMMAQLLQLAADPSAADSSIAGGMPIQNATQGSTSVGFAIPPIKTAFQSWLSSTPYGMQLRALLDTQSAGGLYIGGLPERSAYRKFGGIF